MKSHQLQIFADYHHFYLQDEAAPGDLTDAWSAIAVERMLAVADGVVGFASARNANVTVTVQLLDIEPGQDFVRFDHVVEGSVLIRQGPIVLAGCTDFFAGAARFDIEPGRYRVRFSVAGLNTLSDDGRDGQDHYLVQLWLASPIEPKVLKQASLI